MNKTHTWVSFNRSPVAPLLDSLSLPARSMRFNTPCTCCSVFYEREQYIKKMTLKKKVNIKVYKSVSKSIPH